MSKKIAVLIPCYNESQTIEKVIKDYRKALPDAEIFVYDNNSTDNTDKIAKKAGATVKYEFMQGKGNVVRSQFRDINADVYLMTDGDDTYPPEAAREMCDLVLDGRADMVIGDRLSSTYFTENKRFGHNFGNKIVRMLINKLFSSNVHDVMTGCRAFSYDFVKTFPVISQGFEIETEMTIHALDKNFALCEIPVQYRDRPNGSESKLNTFSDGFKVLGTIFNLLREYRPMLFFNFFATILFVIGAIFLMIPIIEYFNTHIVSRFPTLIVGGFLLVISILLWITGLICDLIARKDRKIFELWRNNIHNK